MTQQDYPGSISLIDETLKVCVFYEKNDCDFRDNICISIIEDCPEDEKVFRSGETNLFITSVQARALANILQSAVDKSEANCSESVS